MHTIIMCTRVIEVKNIVLVHALKNTLMRVIKVRKSVNVYYNTRYLMQESIIRAFTFSVHYAQYVAQFT